MGLMFRSKQEKNCRDFYKTKKSKRKQKEKATIGLIIIGLKLGGKVEVRL